MTRHRNGVAGPLSARPGWAASTKPAAVLAAAGAACLLVVSLTPACSREAAKPAAAASEALPVRVVKVAPQPLEETIDVTGSLVSSVAVDVNTEFAGRIVALLKHEGDVVRRGEAIAQLDEANARLSLAETRAALEVAQATLERVGVAQKASMTELERSQNLMKSGGITQKDFQQAQVTAADVRAQVRLAEAQVDQARQQVAVAQKHLNDCRIVSPIDGEVERKVLNPGTYVDGNVLVYRLVDNQRLEIETSVASAEIARLAKGQKLRFKVAAFPGEEFIATVRALSPAVQFQNRSLIVRASVPNPKAKLKAGMFVNGAIIVGTKSAALVVPPTAIWRRTGQTPFLYVAEENRAHRRDVKLGIEKTDGVEVLDGLRPGDLVVAEQNLELADGTSLAVRM